MYPYFFQFSCFLRTSLFSLFWFCIHVSLFSSCIFFVWTFFMLRSFRVARFWYFAIFMSHFFHVVLFLCCTICMLLLFVALFSCCTFFVLHSFHDALSSVHFFWTGFPYKTSEWLHLFNLCLIETCRFSKKYLL